MFIISSLINIIGKLCFKSSVKPDDFKTYEQNIIVQNSFPLTVYNEQRHIEYSTPLFLLDFQNYYIFLDSRDLIIKFRRYAGYFYYIVEIYGYLFNKYISLKLLNANKYNIDFHKKLYEEYIQENIPRKLTYNSKLLVSKITKYNLSWYSYNHILLFINIIVNHMHRVTNLGRELDNDIRNTYSFI